MWTSIRTWVRNPKSTYKGGPGGTGLESQYWGGGDGQIHWAHWTAGLSFLESAWPVRAFFSKKKVDNSRGMTPEADLWLSHTCTHMSTQTKIFKI